MVPRRDKGRDKWVLGGPRREEGREGKEGDEGELG
jgi:hypothetical protein